MSLAEPRLSDLILKGARAMHAILGRCGIVAATIVFASGCGSSKGWTWGRKNPPNMASMSSAPPSPQLPSAGAVPANYSPNNVAGGPGAANPYDPAQGTGFPGQPAGYNNPGGAPAAAHPAVSNQPYSPPNVGMPQTGPYNEGAPGHPAAAPPAGNYAGHPAADPYSAGQAAAGGYGGPTENYRPPVQGAADPYAQGGAAAGAPYSQTGSPYGPGGAAPESAPQVADNRYADRYATSGQPEQAAADRYAAAHAADPQGGAAPYQPGNTGYQPGNTGYSPPGVPPYQMPSQPNVVSPTRRDPYYRPGGTSDYMPTGGQQMPAAGGAPGSADRYSNPTGAGMPADPYAPPGGYQPPAGQGGY